ncbi:hypothetical protein [Pseudoduganella chitinolytica]|uniref:Uncharacterized protein n=1 Tax=Pseudoduganella chitinolytica TaxID=34070 RepID=A0ABY8BF52_9BURK|nr:hypothetical protein [Pseudoduganella chitinolytica]WEF34331.1 hypothetical protein PX653_06035 [Pseudoduganella chitinolytica]
MLSSPCAHVVPAALLGLSLLALPSIAQPAPCPAGTVVRTAAANDNVCVSPASRRRAAADNARAPLLWVSGPFGPKTCAQGFVWREAFAADTTCVTTAVREETLQENAGPRGDLPP